jgi:hypothetical protein
MPAPIPWTNVILPIALSFTVLQAVSYLIDVRRRTVMAEPSFVSFAAYLDMFPHLIAGPIIRYSWVDKALIERQLTFEDMSIGARRFMLGFAVKVLIADTLAPVVEAAFDLAQPSFVDAWLGNICFAFQIFFDFAGYSAMAIGLGRMLGFKYPENFRDPYLAVTIQDFWRRWHISLSSWLRDYLYISLGGNRYGDVRTYTNLLLTMAIGGLWHGASWSFLAVGRDPRRCAGDRAVLETSADCGGRASLSYPLTMLTVLFAWTPVPRDELGRHAGDAVRPDRAQRVRDQRPDDPHRHAAAARRLDGHCRGGGVLAGGQGAIFAALRGDRRMVGGAVADRCLSLRDRGDDGPPDRALPVFSILRRGDDNPGRSACAARFSGEGDCQLRIRPSMLPGVALLAILLIGLASSLYTLAFKRSELPAEDMSWSAVDRR